MVKYWYRHKIWSNIGTEIKYGQISTHSAGGQVLMVHTLDIKHIKTIEKDRETEIDLPGQLKNAKSL